MSSILPQQPITQYKAHYGLATDMPHVGDAYMPSVESVALAKKFSLFAKTDARSARILYGRDLYATAVFHAQQSVEKATKALALLMGLLKPTYDDVVKGVRHESVQAILLRLPDFVDIKIRNWDKANIDWDKIKDEPGSPRISEDFSFFRGAKGQDDNYRRKIERYELAERATRRL